MFGEDNLPSTVTVMNMQNETLAIADSHVSKVETRIRDVVETRQVFDPLMISRIVEDVHGVEVTPLFVEMSLARMQLHSL